jgi:CRP-like cAMP-binding protein
MSPIGQSRSAKIAGVAQSAITRNRILLRLAREEYQRLRPQFEDVSLSFQQLIYREGALIDYAYFPESGVRSIGKEMRDGGAIETGTVGNEGMVGLPAVLGVGTSSLRVFCQIPGRALRLRAEALVNERRRGGGFADALLRFANATMATLAQSVACNRAHSLEERMCRWLLMTHDRVDSDSFRLTQEFLAKMLGVRRPTVNVAGTSLQRAGLIRYSRGTITITNRAGLEEASCECYAQVRDEFDRSVGDSPVAHRNKR